MNKFDAILLNKNNTNNPTPKYKHECDQCIFLGRSLDGNKDLYYHSENGNQLFLARFDNETDGYKSDSLGCTDYDLDQAYYLAKTRHFIS